MFKKDEQGESVQTRVLLIGVLFLFLVGAKQTVAAEYHQNEILFCLKADRMPLNISRQGDAWVTNYPLINRLLKELGVAKVEKWLPMADERDVIDGVRLSHIYRVVFKNEKSIQQLEQILQKFRLIDDVHSAALESVNRVQGSFEPYIPNDSYFDRQWYLEKIGVPQAWGLWKNELPGDSTILVGIVDTGLDYTHPDLQNIMYVNPGEDVNHDGRITAIDSNGVDDDGNGYVDDFLGWDFAGSKKPNENPDNDVRPPQAGTYRELSHGTHVGGIIAALTDNGIGISGISFRSKLIVTKHSFDDDLTEPGIVKGYSGVLYCAKLGAKIINCSWGGGYDFYGKLVIDNVTKNYGAIVVAAAGNDSHNNDNNHQYPSDFDNAVAVAALRIDDKKAYYSNYGEVVDISAPGGEGSSYSTAILSTIHANAGSYAAWQGTSMAAPVVTGALALLKAWFPDDSRQQLLSRLYSSADPIDGANPSYKGLLGAGRVNVYNAIARELMPKISLTDYKFESLRGTSPAPGDTLSLALTLSNQVNWRDAYHVRAVLRSLSPYAQVLDSVFWIDELPAGAESIWDQSEPRVWIDSLAPLQELTFQLKITANDTSEYPFESVKTLTLTLALNQKGFPISGYGFNAPLTLVKTATENLIVGISTQNEIVVFNQSGKRLVGFPIAVDATSAAPVVADLDRDGQKEIITVNRRGVLRVISLSGKIIKQFDLGEPVYGDLVVGNFDSDPQLEMALGTMRKKLHIFNLDSTEIPGFPKAMSNLMNLGGAVADFNNDGQDDLVIGTFDNKLHLVLTNGDSLTGFPVTLSTRLIANPVVGRWNDSLFVVVATLDNKLVCLNRQGQKVFEIALTESVIGAPMLANLDQEGTPEIVVLTQDGLLHVFTATGVPYGSIFPLDLGAAPQTAPISFDVNNDGKLEILSVVGQGTLRLVQLNGQEIKNFPVSLDEGVTSVPVIDDLDGDGDTEVLVSTQSEVFAIDLPSKAGQAQGWNTYQGNNHRTGSYGVHVTALPANSGNTVVRTFEILNNYPNPFNNQTVIQIQVPGHWAGQLLELKIFDVLGRLVFSQTHPALPGINRFYWDGTSKAGKSLSSGIYFYRVKLGTESRISRLILLK